MGRQPSTHAKNRCPSFTPLAAVQLSQLPPPQFAYFLRKKNMRAEGEGPPTPFPPSFNPPPSPLPPSPSQRWLPFLNPNPTLSRLLYTPELSCRPNCALAFPRFCVSQADVQLSLLAVFSWDCNIDESRTRISFGWNRRQWGRVSSSRSQ